LLFYVRIIVTILGGNEMKYITGDDRNQMIPEGHPAIRGICLNYTYTDISIEYGPAES